MKVSLSKALNNSKLQQGLAAAVTLGLLTGLYLPHAQAATYTGKVGISGVFNTDQKKFGKDIVTRDDQGNIVYNFKGDNTFKMEHINNAVGVSLGVDKNIIINNEGGTLYFDSYSSISTSNGTANGIALTDGDKVVINSDLNIQAHTGSYDAHGITLGINGSGTGKKTELTVNGDVVMRSNDESNPWGVTAGNMYGGMGPGGWVTGELYSPNYTGARWAPSGISLATGHGSNLTINGNVDLAVKGSAVVAGNTYDGDGTINLNGGNIRIDTPESDKNTFYSVANYGGIVNINNTGEHDVNIKGNMLIMNNADGSGEPYFFETGVVNLNLANEKSSWTGVVDNSGSKQAGALNLTLQNGALWQHESLSKTDGMQSENMPSPSNSQYGKYDGISHVASLKGGNSADKAGAILQADKAAINIDNYSGHTVVMYAHNNNGTNSSDYAAGDVVIKHATTGSSITLSTDSKGINMKDYGTVDKVLTSLAGKLTYTGFVNGENNLIGKVQIAEGLTSSSASLDGGDMTFNKQTGKGEYLSNRIVNDIKGGITGEASDKDKGYTITDDTYIFKGNTQITVEDGSDGITTKKDLKINAEDNVLNVNVKAEKDGDLRGLSKDRKGGQLTLQGREFNFNVKNSKYAAEGIYVANKRDQANIAKVTVDGNTNINVEGVGTAVGIYAAYNSEVNINGNLTMKDEKGSWGVKADRPSDAIYSVIGIYACSEENKNSSVVNVNGKVDLAVDGTGVLADSKGSTVNLNGGGIILTNAESQQENYSLAATNGIINMNMNEAKDGAANNTVKLYGNIGVFDDSVSPDAQNKETIINLGLSTEDSE